MRNNFVNSPTVRKQFFFESPRRFSLVAAGKIGVWSGKGQGKVKKFQSWYCVATMFKVCSILTVGDVE